MSRDLGCKIYFFYFSPTSILETVTIFEGNWLKNKKVTGKTANLEGPLSASYPCEQYAGA